MGAVPRHRDVFASEVAKGTAQTAAVQRLNAVVRKQSKEAVNVSRAKVPDAIDREQVELLKRRDDGRQWGEVHAAKTTN